MVYELNYSKETGKVDTIQHGIDTIPLAEGNTDYQAFLACNAKQDVPLDLDSTIEVIVPEPKTQEVFPLPVVAPDFLVQSPKPKKNHMKAHAEAIAESKKAIKSIGLIVLDLMVYIEELEKRISSLEAKK